MIWSVVPAEFIFQGYGETQAQPKHEVIQIHGVTMIVEATGFGQAKIERLISPRASDYMKPEWMPGQMIRLFP